MRGGSHTNNYPLFAKERVLSAETVPDPAGRGAAAADQLRRLADEYVDDLARRHPDIATELGDHRFDELLPDRSEAALADERRALDAFAARLTDLDGPALEPELRVDAALMAGDLARRLFEIEELREHTWNPLLANPGSAIYMLLARDYAPLPERLHSLAGRLARVPDALTAARASLGRTPREVLDRLGAAAPDEATILAFCAQALAAQTAFVRDHDLVTVYDDPVELIDMPA